MTAWRSSPTTSASGCSVRSSAKVPTAAISSPWTSTAPSSIHAAPASGRRRRPRTITGRLYNGHARASRPGALRGRPRSHLETERLLLRPLEEDDLEALAEFAADPETMRYIGAGATRTRDETAESLVRMRRFFAVDGYGQLAVVRRSDGRF